MFANGKICAPASNPARRRCCKADAGQGRDCAFKPARDSPTPFRRRNAAAVQDLGDLHFKISTTSAQAQAYFDQGLRLTFGFNHAEAARALPRCANWTRNARCAFGAKGSCSASTSTCRCCRRPLHPRWPPPKMLRREAQRRAMPKGAHRGLGQALPADPKAERAALDKAFADAMTEAAAKFRNDDIIRALFADALMNLFRPWDY